MSVSDVPEIIAASNSRQLLRSRITVHLPGQLSRQISLVRDRPHNLDTFMNPQHKIVETGCSTCQKHFGTIEQFKRHLTDDVLPSLLDKLSRNVQESAEGETAAVAKPLDDR